MFGNWFQLGNKGSDCLVEYAWVMVPALFSDLQCERIMKVDLALNINLPSNRSIFLPGRMAVKGANYKCFMKEIKVGTLSGSKAFLKHIRFSVYSCKLPYFILVIFIDRFFSLLLLKTNIVSPESKQIDYWQLKELLQERGLFLIPLKI